MELQTHTLPNGIRLVHQSVPSKVAHIGMFINAGTRDENDREHGIAHFIEHTIFKGTEKRNVYQVLNRLENVGADLNAYTSKEETCIYATFLNEYYDRTLELFQDILFHPTFPEKELEKEKQVVMDEIRSYQDNPADQIFDDFEDLVFAGHPLGKNILGTVKSLKHFSREDLLGFIRRNYCPEEIVVVSVGNVEFPKLLRLVTKYFSQTPERRKPVPRLPFEGYEVVTRLQKKKTFMVHCMVGCPGYSFSDERRIPLALLNNMLGGPILNSRLSLALRERNGLTYHNESNYTAYSDAGIVSIYFGTDPAQYEKALEIVHQELARIRNQKLTTLQLHTIQKQLTGQLAIAQESNLGLMLSMGKNFLLQDKFDSLETIISKINDSSAEELLEIANDIFDPVKLSMLTFQVR
ncbi:MAG: pitrilysin family protein [Bacteroidetes bacterium]|nr:pitrilysin family protein [Bacteroidota bacterium]